MDGKIMDLIRKLLIILALTIASDATTAQETDTIKMPRWEWALSLSADVPTSFFKRNMNQVGLGASIQALYRLDDKGFYLSGLDFKFSQFDSDRATIQEEIDGEIVEVELYAESEYYALSGLLRYQVETDFWLWPFAEVSLGGIYFVLDTDNGIETDRSFAWRLGLNGGLQYGIPNSNLHVQIRCGYLVSLPVNYYTANESGSIDPIDNFDVSRSSATMITVELGAGMIF